MIIISRLEQVLARCQYTKIENGDCSAALHAADPLRLFTYYLDGHQESPSTGGDHDTNIVYLNVSEDILCHVLDKKLLGFESAIGNTL